jgi:hypothetical protein
MRSITAILTAFDFNSSLAQTEHLINDPRSCECLDYPILWNRHRYVLQREVLQCLFINFSATTSPGPCRDPRKPVTICPGDPGQARDGTYCHLLKPLRYLLTTHITEAHPVEWANRNVAAIRSEEVHSKHLPYFILTFMQKLRLATVLLWYKMQDEIPRSFSGGDDDFF